MSEAKHTPGPWRLHEGVDYFEVSAADDSMVCRYWKADEARDRADGELIAAAPELLAVADEAESAIHEILEARPYPRGGDTQLDVLRRRLRAAIAKAEGRTP